MSTSCWTLGYAREAFEAYEAWEEKEERADEAPGARMIVFRIEVSRRYVPMGANKEQDSNMQ